MIIQHLQYLNIVIRETRSVAAFVRNYVQLQHIFGWLIAKPRKPQDLGEKKVYEFVTESNVGTIARLSMPPHQYSAWEDSNMASLAYFGVSPEIFRQLRYDWYCMLFFPWIKFKCIFAILLFLSCNNSKVGNDPERSLKRMPRDTKRTNALVSIFVYLEWF